MWTIKTRKRSLVKDPNEYPFAVRIFIYIYFALSFFEPYLDGVLGNITRYYIFALIVVLFFFAKKMSLKQHHGFYIFWLLYVITTLLWSANFTIPKIHAISIVGMVVLFCVFSAVTISAKVIDGIIKTMFFSSTAIGFLSLFFSKPYHGDVENRLVLNLFGQETDPNNQAAFVAVGIAIGLCYLLVERENRLLSLAVVIINFYSLLLTGSRGGFITAAVITVAIIVLKTNRHLTKKKIKRLIAVAFICVVVAGLIQIYLPDSIVARLFTFEDYEGGSNRAFIWSNAWDLCMQKLNLIFGAGWGSYYGYNDVYHAVHNTYLSMLCDVGIIGFFAFFYPIGKNLIYLIQKKDVMSVCLAIAGFVPAIFLDTINKRFFWNAIIIVFVIANYLKEKQEGKVV